MGAIKINKGQSIEHKNGYWIYHTHSTSASGVEYKSKTKKTYAKMLDMWFSAKEAGFCGESVMKAVQSLLDN